MNRKRLLKYQQMRSDFLLDKGVSEKEWTTYCTSLLYEIMEENKDVYKRLKNE